MTLTKEQHAARADKPGGSEVAAILNCSKWQQPYHVWLRLTGRWDEVPDLHKDEESEVLFWGSKQEDTIGTRWAELTGNKIRRLTRSIENPKYPWLVGHIDRDIVGVRELLEIKNVGWRLGWDWGESDTDEVADYVIPQPRTYMMLMDYEVAHVAALIGGNEFRKYVLTRDKEWDELIVEMTHEFYYEYVKKDIPPPIDFEHRTTTKLLDVLYKTVEKDGKKNTVIDLPPKALSWVEVWQEANAKAKEYEAIVTGAKNHLKAMVGNAGRAVLTDDRYIERKPITRREYVSPESTYMSFRVVKPRK